MPTTAPRPLLYQLARHSLLLAYATAAHRIGRRAGTITGSGHLDPELPNINPGDPTETLWERLEKAIPTITGPEPLGEFLDQPAREKQDDVRELGELRASLRELAPRDTVELERLLAGTLDLAAHRFDAWATSLATQRLKRLRANKPAGIRLGGYGWLEELRPSVATTPNGFVQVPSLDHAAMAAVLASGYLSHRNSTGPAPFEIDLSSDRVRTARWLLQGVRGGQTLGALLGYRIERGMHTSFARHVDLVRTAYPLGSGIDGLTLLDERRLPRDSQRFFRFFRLTQSLGDDLAQVDAIFQAADQELDALGDLLLAEGVFQATRGNFERAGQTLGAVAQGQSLPEPEVMDTPRTGVVVTHRVVTLLKGKITAPKGKAATPRALAEPRLNAWAATWLGDLKRVRCRVNYAFEKGTAERTLALTELALAPLDLLANSAENLETLLLTQARGKRPTGVPANAPVQLVRDRDPAWERQIVGWSEFCLLVGAARKLMASVRPLAAGDLAPADQPNPADFDADELRKRADAAVAKLKKTAALESAPLALRSFGIFEEQGAVVAANERLKRLKEMSDAFARDKASPAEEVAHDIERIRTVFGAAFPVLPVLKPGNAGELGRSFAASEKLQGGNELEVSAWLNRVAEVRPPVGRMASLSRLAAALHGFESPSSVAQIPFVEDERWVGLPASPGTIPGGRISLVACGDVPNLETPISGLVIDEWAEMIPNARETTGLVFQFDRPGARPPQGLLLAVAPDVNKPWDLDALETTVLETLELTQLRLVDQDALLEFDQFLPALCFALNAAGDTVSTDFT